MLTEPTAKARVLIEALPYIKRFHHQYVVVKVGGEAVEDPAVIETLLTDLVWLEQVGVIPVLAHGGGARISRAMDAAGIEVRWHEGRRVTDARAMAVILREIEAINAHLVERICELGGAAIGLMPPRQGTIAGAADEPALGLVGRPVGIDRERLTRYGSRGLIPVIPPLSVARNGAILNTNADDVALAVATGMRAEKLVFCSNVPGVCTDPDDPRTLISSLPASRVLDLIADGTISGGMIPKVQSCLGALELGVGKIHIIHAGTEHALLLEIFTAEGVGTELVADAGDIDAGDDDA